MASSTQNQALAAPLFLYRDVLEQELPWVGDIVRARRPRRLPVALTPDEVRAVLTRLEGPTRLMAYLIYGTGLRLLECCRLRMQDLDFAANQLVVRAGKGKSTGAGPRGPDDRAGAPRGRPSAARDAAHLFD